MTKNFPITEPILIAIGQIADDAGVAAYVVGGFVRDVLLGRGNDRDIDISTFSLSPEKISALIQLVDDGKVNFSIASSKIFNALLVSPQKTPLQIATELNLLQDSDSGSVAAWVDEVIAKMPDKVKEYKTGKKGLIGLFVGEVKKLSKGKADMNLVNKLLAEKLN